MSNDVTAANVAQMQQGLELVGQTLEVCASTQTNTEQNVEQLMQHWDAGSRETFTRVMAKFSERVIAIRGQLDTVQSQLQDTLQLQIQTEETAQDSMSGLQQLLEG
ncbi:hypothetical protein ACFUJR_34555 [Streptomyces sp. NPDC057271]|uniref:hypothetical protein n=1 Tax=unclassified Streptomyces TaxID=2593676 RepID=UPI003630BE56